MQNNLLPILQGCLSPTTVNQSQSQLVQYSKNQYFLSHLLQLLPNQPVNISVMILTTLKNYIQERYNNPHNPMPGAQKELLRQNLFQLYYVVKAIGQGVALYKEIMYMIVAVDIQAYGKQFCIMLDQDLDGGIQAGVYFCRQVARFYQYLTKVQRQPFDQFIMVYFPKLEQLVQKILSDYNNVTRKLLTQILQTFYSAFHVQVPEYLRNFDNIDKWLLYLHTGLQAPLDDYVQNHIQITRCYVKLFSMYCRDGTDGKQYRGWASQFRKKYAQDLYTKIVTILINPLPNEQVMSNILTSLTTITNNPDLQPMLQPDHCHAIIYKHILPYMESTNEDYQYFKNDGLQYIRRMEDLTCHPFRRTGLDLIKGICEKCGIGDTTGIWGKGELIKFIEYAAEVLTSNASSDKQKQVILITITELSPLIFKNSYLSKNFQPLVQQYFLPLLKSSNPILTAQTLNMLSTLLQKAHLSTNTVSDLMAIIYDKMCGQNIVIRYYGVLAFTELLEETEALESARPHFKNILQIYVKMLDLIDHENLLKSLKSIVQTFSNQIVSVATDLTNHLLSIFNSFHNRQPDQNDDHEQNESRQATAALSTINQILNSPLSLEAYHQISEKVMILLQGLCGEYNDYFAEIVNIFNTLAYKGGQSLCNYQFPYLLARKLLEGDNSILAKCQNNTFVQIISEAQQADQQYSQSLISIIKNLLQKSPQADCQTLLSYPAPKNPQLLLCLLQNKKLSQSQLSNLDTSQLDEQWKLILQAYSFVVFGGAVGSICEIERLKMLSGVSLFPWIQGGFGVEVVRRVLRNLEEQEEEESYGDEENTVQMLEKFANEDEDEDAEDFYISSGGNYSYMYDSPYDSDHDVQYLLNRLKKMTNQEIGILLGMLNNKYRTKLENLIANNNSN